MPESAPDVTHEALRVYPVSGMPLERYVPAPGLELPRGIGFVPAGTVVGINPYVAGRNRQVWGGDAGAFPKAGRWRLEEDDGASALLSRVAAMVGDATGTGTPSALMRYIRDNAAAIAEDTAKVLAAVEAALTRPRGARAIARSVLADR
ncbi:hypothetical protein GGR56DRAFT_678755 [Xylariaceae sp. FL0804]|nr:hypothetical protein GGR56DRAFT_678755 [Xylariaceae sp. FL0804]